MAGGKCHQWKQRKHFAFGSREEIRGGGSPALSSGPLSSGPAALESAVLRVQWDTGPRRVSRDARILPAGFDEACGELSTAERLNKKHSYSPTLVEGFVARTVSGRNLDVVISPDGGHLLATLGSKGQLFDEK